MSTSNMFFFVCFFWVFFMENLREVSQNCHQIFFFNLNKSTDGR